MVSCTTIRVIKRHSCVYGHNSKYPFTTSKFHRSDYCLLTQKWRSPPPRNRFFTPQLQREPLGTTLPQCKTLHLPIWLCLIINWQYSILPNFHTGRKVCWISACVCFAAVPQIIHLAEVDQIQWYTWGLDPMPPSRGRSVLHQQRTQYSNSGTNSWIGPIWETLWRDRRSSRCHF